MRYASLALGDDAALAVAALELELSESAVAVGGGLMGEESLLVDDSLIA